MQIRTMMAAVVLAGLLPPAAAAQESSERGDLWRVRVFDVAPAHVIQWANGVQKIAQAASESNLEQQWGWTVWADFPQYYVSNPVPNMAAFDDPGAWNRQFEGTDGQATLQEAMQDLQGLDAKVISDEIYEYEAGWSYTPEQPAFDGTPGGADLSEFYIAPGKSEEFQSIVGEAIAMLEKIGYPYTMSGYRVIMGEGQKTVFVTFWDTREAYYGENSQDRLLEQHGMTQAWQELVARFLDTISNAKSRTIEYSADMSHWQMN
jgi:hypothetical protein